MVRALATGLSGLFLVFPASAEPPALPMPVTSELAYLAEQVGACHRARALSQARTAAPVDRIVARTLAACRAPVARIHDQLAPLVGEQEAERVLGLQRLRWTFSIRQLVIAQRARR